MDTVDAVTIADPRTGFNELVVCGPRAPYAWSATMRMGMIATAAAAGLLSLSGCSSSGEEEAADPPTQGAPSSRDEDSDESQGELLESGFGQEGQYAQGVALVENTSDHAGQTVTVSFNFLDESGGLIATESQVNSFNYEGQTISVLAQTDLGSEGVRVASVEPTLLVEDNDVFEETEVDFGTAEGLVKKDEFGGWTAQFTIANPTSEPLQSPSIGAVCKNAAGAINGGGIDFPDLVPPEGEVSIQPDLIVSGEPVECTAYVAGPVF